MGEEKARRADQESLSVATRTGAAKTVGLPKVIVDTTVQEKAVAFPTDAKLMHRARERLVRLAEGSGVDLRQSYVRVGKIALIRHSATPTPSSSSAPTRRCRRIKTYLGRVMRDIARKISGRTRNWQSVFAQPLMLARRVREQRQRQRGRKVYCLHAPEVECIGKGKAHKPYEFGVKVSRGDDAQSLEGRPVHRPVKALPGNHMTATRSPAIIPEIESGHRR